jgi:CRP-like cAMP-binding protein
MNSVWFFEEVNLFNLLCPHKYKAHKASHELINYKKQDYIYFEDDSSNKVFLIDKGKVKLGYYTEDGNEIVKAILSKGELFGEKAILGEGKRNEFAMAMDDRTSLCPIGVETMHDLMRDNRPFSFRIYKLIGFRIKRLERRLELLLFKDAKTRVEEFLKELADDYGKPSKNEGEIIINHPYTQKEIATLIGTSRPTLNSILNQLKEDNHIDFSRNTIIMKFSSKK